MKCELAAVWRKMNCDPLIYYTFPSATELKEARRRHELLDAIIVRYTGDAPVYCSADHSGIATKEKTAVGDSSVVINLFTQNLQKAS